MMLLIGTTKNTVDHQKATALAESLKALACVECTKGWLKEYQGLTDPIEDIKDCASLGLITTELKERLVNEIQEIIDTT